MVWKVWRMCRVYVGCVGWRVCRLCMASRIWRVWRAWRVRAMTHHGGSLDELHHLQLIHPTRVTSHVRHLREEGEQEEEKRR